MTVLAAGLITVPRAAAQGSRIDPVELDNPTNAAVQTELGRVQGARLRVTVLTADQKPLDRQSVVKLYSETKKTTMWLATTGRSDVEFTGLASGKYEIEASSVGYFSAHKAVELGTLLGTVEVAVVVERDPSAINREYLAEVVRLDALPNGLNGVGIKLLMEMGMQHSYSFTPPQQRK